MTTASVSIINFVCQGMNCVASLVVYEKSDKEKWRVALLRSKNIRRLRRKRSKVNQLKILRISRTTIQSKIDILCVLQSDLIV